MKKIFIRLLFVAAGAVILYACLPGNTSERISGKGLLIGKWEMDSIDISKATDTTMGLLALVYITQDSNHKNIQFTFHSDGLITEVSDENDSDSSRYEWEGEKDLLIWAQDSTKEKWNIQRLDSLKLIVTAEDSVTFYFNRVKQK